MYVRKGMWLVSPPNARRHTPCLAAMPTMRGAEFKSNCTITPGILSARERSVLSYRIKRKTPEGAVEPCRTGTTTTVTAILPVSPTGSSRSRPSPCPSSIPPSYDPIRQRTLKTPCANARQIVLVLSVSMKADCRKQRCS